MIDKENGYETARLSFFSVVLLFMVSISACAPASTGSADPSEGGSSSFAISEELLAQRAQDYVDQFQSGDFSSVFQDGGEELAASCTQDSLSADWSACLASARTFRRQETPVVSASGDGWQVEVASVHARYQICSQLLFASDGTVSHISFSLRPLEVTPESGDSWYETPITLGYDAEKPLNGMLTLPRDAERPPVVILVSGSGANSMDSLIGAADNRFFADLAHGLAEQGIASIRYDKRSYAYPGDVIDIQTEYLYDVKDAVRLAREDTRVDGDEIYLIGHSQGGMLSPKLVTDNPEFRGLISMGGTLRRMEDLILEQNEVMNALNTALTPEERDAANAEVAQLVAEIKALDADADASPDTLLYGYPETYWKSLNQIDSMGLAEQLAEEEYPMLILQGINDFQVLYDTDFALWQEVVADNPNAACIAYEGLSHVFMPGTPEFDGTVYDAPAHVEPAVIEDIAAWILSS